MNKKELEEWDLKDWLRARFPAEIDYSSAKAAGAIRGFEKAVELAEAWLEEEDPNCLKGHAHDLAEFLRSKIGK